MIPKTKPMPKHIKTDEPHRSPLICRVVEFGDMLADAIRENAERIGEIATQDGDISALKEDGKTLRWVLQEFMRLFGKDLLG